MSAPDDVAALREQVTYWRNTAEGWKARAKAPASLAPQPKVVAGGVAGALVVVLVWVANLLGLDVPDYVALAAVVVISSGAAYVKRQ
jgi:hypothetical protein